jgi:hypothetical protein
VSGSSIARKRARYRSTACVRIRGRIGLQFHFGVIVIFWRDHNFALNDIEAG